jgi:amidohydrolase
LQEVAMKKHLSAGLLIVLILAAVPRLPGATVDEKIRALAKQIEAELIAVRRDLHAHPELGLQEKRTASLVAAYLKKLGLEVRTGFAVTGVLGVLKGGKPGPVVAMRGDMDGLPITEETGLSFASKARALLDGRECGLMHACGHDIHTTMLLGVARVLAALKDDLPGTVLFVAQPAEEYGDGARRMIEDGVFKNLKPEACFAYHVDDSLKVGKIGYTSGFSSANVDGFTLVIKSEGCHGANPWLCVDPIVVGARIVLDLQVMLAREIDVSNNAVITVGKFHAGTAENVIPRTAELAATVRNYGEDQRRLLKEKVGRLVAGACAEAGAAFDLDYQFGIPSRYNDPKLLAEILPTAARVLGGQEALVEQLPEMGGEDFAYFSQVAPSVMLNLGVVPANLEKTSVHSPTFLADEAGIALGVELMADIIMDYLARRQGRAE